MQCTVGNDIVVVQCTPHGSALHCSMVQNLGFGLGAGRSNYTALLHCTTQILFHYIDAP